MKIDIDKLSESELVDLNRRIVERLRFLHQMRAHKSMLEFSVGDKVSFEPEDEPPVFGVITRYNKKTVSVLSEDGRNWRVSPQYLRKVKDISRTPGTDNVVPVKRK
jgi:ribosomal protein S17